MIVKGQGRYKFLRKRELKKNLQHIRDFSAYLGDEKAERGEIPMGSEPIHMGIWGNSEIGGAMGNIIWNPAYIQSNWTPAALSGPTQLPPNRGINWERRWHGIQVIGALTQRCTEGRFCKKAMYAVDFRVVIQIRAKENAHGKGFQKTKGKTFTWCIWTLVGWRGGGHH